VAVSAKKRAGSGGETIPSSTSAGQFLREVYEELRKVVWPTWGELYRYTLVVIFTVIVLGAFIGGVDYALSQIIKSVIYKGGTA
jgi:preprotein translocase subunit SecE